MAVPTKLHINIQQGIIDVEGETDLVREVYADFKDHLLQSAAHSHAPGGDGNGERPSATPGNRVDLSTNSIAARLNVSSGPELVVAAVAHLMLTQSKEKCTRDEINDEIKRATNFYKKNMTSNLSSSLKTLVKSKRLNEISTGVYALASDERSSIEAKLAQHG